LRLKKNYLKELFILIKSKRFDEDNFSEFFTYKKKFENEGFEEVIILDVFIRYNKLSNKIEILFNDISNRLKNHKTKVEKKIKKKFLK